MHGAALVAHAVREFLREGKSNHITVLLRLREADEASLSDIQRWLAGGRYRAQYNWTLSIVSELKEAGLVEERVVQAGKLKVRLYRLTEKGEGGGGALSEALRVARAKQLAKLLPPARGQNRFVPPEHECFVLSNTR
jgi:DNA-binding HxlR family transcriptional regulator